MSNRGPVITLLAVATLAAVLFGFNLTTTRQTATSAASAPPPPPPAAAQAPATAPAEPPPAAAQPPTAPQQATYAGRTSGNEATIAIAVRNGQVTAYVCDGRRVEAWLKGTIVDGRLTVQGPNGDSATGAVEGDAIFGTVWVNDAQWPYSAQLASPPAGLYQGSATVNGVPNRIGWIVLQDGSQTGVLSNRNGIREPAPRIDPQALRGVIVGGTRIDPQRVVGGPPS